MKGDSLLGYTVQSHLFPVVNFCILARHLVQVPDGAFACLEKLECPVNLLQRRNISEINGEISTFLDPLIIANDWTQVLRFLY